MNRQISRERTNRQSSHRGSANKLYLPKVYYILQILSLGTIEQVKENYAKINYLVLFSFLAPINYHPNHSDLVVLALVSPAKN